MNIAVIGAGAVGGWLAARLALAGNRVMAVSKRRPVDRITLSDGGSTAQARLASLEGAADLVVIAVKAPALADAAEAARPLVGPQTAIVPMLNGVPWWFTGERLCSVDTHGRIAAALPQRQVVGSVVHASCRRLAPDHVEVVQSDRLILGEPGGGTSERVATLCALFETAGIRCDASDCIRRSVWYKLWGNATLNPLSALTRSTADILLADPAIRAFMAEAMDELAAVGAAIGCPIEETSEDRMKVTARLGAFKTSMLQDVEARRPIEIDALVGAPIEIARKSGIATPQLDRIYALTRLLAGSSGLSVSSE